MAITVVQTASITGPTNPPWTFTGNVAAGNTVFLVVGAYTSASATIATSGPKFGGSTVSGATAIYSPGSGNGIMSPLNGTNGAYLAIWVLPNLAGGSNSIDLTVTGQTGITGAVMYEVNGLGNAPVIDKKAPGGSNATTTAIDSGATGAISTGPEFVLGAAQTYAGSAAGPAGFTSVNPTANTWAGYQIPAAGGSSYDWAQTASGSNPWSAGAVTAAAVIASPAPVYPLNRVKAKLPPVVLRGRRALSSPGIPVTNPGVSVYGTMPGPVRAALPLRIAMRRPSFVITVAPGITLNGTATLTGAGTLASPSVIQSAASPVLTGAGSVTANSGTGAQGTATLTGAGSVTAIGVIAGTATLTGAAALTAPVTQGSPLTLTGAGTVDAGVVPPFQVARSTETVADPRDGTATVS